MKRAIRDRVLGRLYMNLQSEDFDDREYALFQLAQMLRRANDGAPDSGGLAADDQLPRDLQRIRLSPSDQERIVALLLRMVSRFADSQASAFWTLGGVPAQYAFSPALAAIEDYGEQFSDETAYQACRALQNWLAAEDFAPNLDRAQLADTKRSHWLKRWSHSSDARVARRAQSVLGRARELSA